MQTFQRKKITKKLLEGFRALPQNAFDRSYHQPVMQKVFQAVREKNPDLLFRSLVLLKWAGLMDLLKDREASAHLFWLSLDAEEGDMAARAIIRAIADALTSWGTGPPTWPEEEKRSPEEIRGREPRTETEACRPGPSH